MTTSDDWAWGYKEPRSGPPSYHDVGNMTGFHMRFSDDEWRSSPTAPCGCEWDGWHCPHCGSVTSHSGDAWEPAHTLGCHRRDSSRTVEA